MAETFSELNEKHINFIKAQKIFFVATAPSNLKDEFVNLSPKGYDVLEILDNKTVVYADYPGSGNETATHLQQNGRLTIMFASFDKTPMILRLYGHGEAA
ncbi:MAG: pyridoxamine 5'-phosphate oxidase family protein [Nitrospirae bacterium]|nr:pyridoxamine 5'-phosphate oxidase family protein [Nitrospirota bacterium]